MSQLLAKLLSTNDFAAALGIKPGTVRSHVSRFGSYYGIRPVKMPNRLMLWPKSSVEQLTGITDEADKKAA